MLQRVGNCRILGEIGSGGMSVVYKAIQEPLGRIVAVKALKPSVAADSVFAKRFEREAQFMASLQHENILHVYDFIKEDGMMFIIMEYVNGIDLYDLLQRTPRLPVDVAAIIALQVARALDYAHFRGIIHRDIKPANIMISENGEVKLMDFGIARDDRLGDLTETGTGIGTPSYMSPEQILGDKLDFRSDLFSLGIVLYQMVTGRKPFVEDEIHTVMQKIRLDRYTNPRKINSAIPRSLERIMARCMEKLPANRYPTTQALIDDLQDFLASRVSMNHNARLVMYLREVGLISGSKAEEMLAASAPSRLRRPWNRQLLREAWMVQAGIGAFTMASFFSILSLAGGSDKMKIEQTIEEQSNSIGFIKFIVEPWANVFIDGEFVFVTPMARAIPLKAGRHFIRLENPFYHPIEKEVLIQENETVIVREKMIEK